MSFVVIEGLDGSGKSTQINRVRNYLEEQNIKFKYLHFPRTDTGIYGDLVARFLRGELGAISEVDPYLVALIYAGDRNEAAGMIRKWLKEGYFVLLDRYVYSNIAFQCAKFEDPLKQKELKNWILNLEFSYHKLPVPDINVFLDVPFEFTKTQLKESRAGEDRAYLRGAIDIHEESLELQQKVRQVYLSLSGEKNFRILKCYDQHGNILTPDIIFEELLNTVFVK